MRGGSAEVKEGGSVRLSTALTLGLVGVGLLFHGMYRIHPIAGELTVAAWCMVMAKELYK